MLERSLNTLFSTLLVFVSLAMSATGANAGTVSSCTVGGGSLAFGTYQPSNGNRTTVGSVQMSCTCRGNNETPVTGSTFVALAGAPTLWWLAGHCLRPLQELTTTVAGRQPQETTPLAHTPAVELEPIVRVLNVQWQQQRDAGLLRAQAFSWQRCAQITARVYRQVVKS